MRRMAIALAGAAIIALASQTSQANTLSLGLSSPDDLNNLTVGQPFTVDVSLAGLEAGEQLVSLTGSALFPGGILGAPASIDPGAIVPQPLADPLDFLTFADLGQADAAFSTFSADPAFHITADGVFYSFDLTAGARGSGQIQLAPLALGAEQFDPQAPGLPILRDVEAGPPLPFHVDGIGIIPEPISAALVPLALAGLGHYAARRRGTA